MKPYIPLALTALLVGCAAAPQKVPDPVVVTTTSQVQIDESLLTPCEVPSFMSTAPMSQQAILAFSQKEAIKLIICGSKHKALSDTVRKAFNIRAATLQKDSKTTESGSSK